ncbi:PHO85 cyclin-1 [Coemansia sp. RSA 1358]|uniref:PHO85 cyclin-1 n=1 Tax=Coemansia umbellata TaxID=1424467 RepID=A0ABQ8PLC8_9FUNG|nr:PHO85 cyclin-1 [Coemansia umbellata]KAJ2624931.1 PHO85 cyclin-1 [Coemansia sp. RSA 1358]
MLAASNGNSTAFSGNTANPAASLVAVAPAMAAVAAAAQQQQQQQQQQQENPQQEHPPQQRTQTIHTLYHIPQTLTTFTVNFLSQLFSAVEKPLSQLKRPDIPVDTRKFPEFRYFIRTLLINGRISADTLVHALIYLSRFHQRVAQKQALVEEGAKHKLFLAALLVASKFCDDRYPLATISVCEFLPLGLLSLAEINRMERAFLKVIKYKLIVDPDELALLLSRHGIDIKQIAKAIAERLTIGGTAPRFVQPQGTMMHQPLSTQPAAPTLMSVAAISQRAMAGHSTSARTVGSAVLSTTSLAHTASSSTIIHNAQLETIADRPRRAFKPLPPQPEESV